MTEYGMIRHGRRPAVRKLAFLAVGVAAIWLLETQQARGELAQEEVDRILATYAQARNTPDLALLAEIYASEVVVHDCSSPEVIHGLPALQTYYKASHEGIPDFRISFHIGAAAGDWVVSRWTIDGTHTGDLRGLPPTGRKVHFSGVALSRVEDGKITEEWIDFNVLDLMTQLGFSLTPPSQQ